MGPGFHRDSAARTVTSRGAGRCRIAMTVMVWENTSMRLEQVVAEMPAGFDVLRAEARAEGYRHIDRLADEWVAGTMRFDRDGEALIAASLDRQLAGIGGITIDPSQSV